MKFSLLYLLIFVLLIDGIFSQFGGMKEKKHEEPDAEERRKNYLASRKAAKMGSTVKYSKSSKMHLSSKRQSKTSTKVSTAGEDD